VKAHYLCTSNFNAMPKKNSKRAMTRLVKVLKRNAELKQAANRSYPRPANAPQPAVLGKREEQKAENQE
jgi:hypothetical protein